MRFARSHGQASSRAPTPIISGMQSAFRELAGFHGTPEIETISGAPAWGAKTVEAPR
jgi:hypothetical protein